MDGMEILQRILPPQPKGLFTSLCQKRIFPMRLIEKWKRTSQIALI